MDITFYTIHCTACDELQFLLDKNGIKYTVVDDEDEVIKIAEANNIYNAPILKVANTVYDYTDAIEWIKEHN